MEKTIKDWLQELPDGYRELALANENPEYNDYDPETPSIGDAVGSAFAWHESPEGFDFWRRVHDAINGGGAFPPLPSHPQDPTNEAEATLQIMDQRDRAIELLKEASQRLVFYDDYESVGKIETFLNQIKP